MLKKAYVCIKIGDIVMRVLPISNYGNVQVKRTNRVFQNQKPESVQGDTVSFKGNYYETYKNALQTPIRNLNDCNQLFDRLKRAVLSENLTIKLDHILSLDREKMLHEARWRSATIIAKSNKYPSQLMSLDGSAVSFHHPEYGEFGNGSIYFYKDGDSIHLSRDNDSYAFWPNGQIKEYCRTASDGSVIERVYYDEDGSKPFWKNFFA